MLKVKQHPALRKFPMSRYPQLYPWTQEIATRLPTLSPALATVLALWTIGMIFARRCGLDSVTTHVASLLGQGFDIVRQRLREFYQEAQAKRDTNRKDFQTDTCFTPLLGWLLWLVAVGAECEHAARVETIGPLPADAREGKERGRQIRLFVQGVAAVLAALINGAALPHSALPQQNWPESSHIPTMTEEEFLKNT
jgi:hypothetical protein